ncbi:MULTISPECIES: hypothetical protein [unclassified Novosphingobium]|uniref:hypothetical protein n=1 Tax=unclassified Novosphingobium TaxID=2644732 RepID=UPI00146B32BB|nr:MULTISPECIES: hypothetical protein [unclassified Novosphingobium]NMN06282.1 outer membrane biosynthesis protein TonB [Novosphingobium sp. SG919]NMN88580.1 outer membrane biosynthesis protein TonB [Novosphingobium sp. SG916]
MRGISILLASTRTLLVTGTLLAMPAMASAQTASQATPQAAPTQPIVSAVPTPSLPTLNSPTPAPAIKPSAPAASTLVPLPQAGTPAVVLPQGTPNRTAPTRRPAAQPKPPAPAPAAVTTPAASATPAPETTPTPSLSPVPEPSPSAAPEAATDTPAPETSATPAPLVPATTSDGATTAWWPWAAGLGALAVIIAVLALRRRRATTVQAQPTPAPVPAPRPAPKPPVPKPAPTPSPAPQPLPVSPQADQAAPGLELALLADRLSATLVNATLSCRLVLTNHGAAPLIDLALSGDMTSAHASRPMDEQLGLAGPELPPLRLVEQLAPGESVTVAAEMRLPLSSILTIRAGAAQLFVPIVRASVWATKADDGGAQHAHGAFLVGQPAAPGDQAARLQPFRLDQGPRVFDALDQRAMPLPAL